jgi:hypothetical protein
MKLFSTLKSYAVLMAVLALMNVGWAHGGGGNHGGGMRGSDDESSSDDMDSYRQGDGEWNHHHGGDGSCRDSDGFFNRDTYWTNLTTCDEEYECSLYHHHRHDDSRNGNVNGTFVCRTTFHPITGERFSRVRCIPTDRAWETDVCGCCGDTCPDLSNSTSCLDLEADEEDNVIQFALGTSDASSSSQLSSNCSPNTITRDMMLYSGASLLGVFMLMLA